MWLRGIAEVYEPKRHGRRRYRISNGSIPSPICLWARGVNTVSWGLGMRSILIFKQYMFPVSVPCIGMTSACAHTLQGFIAYHPRWLKGGFILEVCKSHMWPILFKTTSNCRYQLRALSINAGADISAPGLRDACSPRRAFDMDDALDRHRDSVFCISISP